MISTPVRQEQSAGAVGRSSRQEQENHFSFVIGQFNFPLILSMTDAKSQMRNGKWFFPALGDCHCCTRDQEGGLAPLSGPPAAMLTTPLDIAWI